MVLFLWRTQKNTLGFSVRTILVSLANDYKTSSHIHLYISVLCYLIKHLSFSKSLYIIYLIYFLSSPLTCTFHHGTYFNALYSLLYSRCQVHWLKYSVSIFLIEWMTLEIWHLNCDNEKDIGTLGFLFVCFCQW